MASLEAWWPDAAPPDPVLFSARLLPHRSLSQVQFRRLLLAVAGIGFASTLPFVVMGAWPVLGFMGLDVLVVYAAFRANFRAARAYEDVEVTTIQLTLAKVSARGRRAEWRFNPVWVRLERQDHAEFGTQRLDLVARADRIEVGAFLGPDAKGRFADDLGRALAQARRGYRFDRP